MNSSNNQNTINDINLDEFLYNKPSKSEAKELFKLPLREYSMEIAKKLYEKDRETAIKYIKCYIFKSDVGTYYKYSPSENTFKLINKNDILNIIPDVSVTLQYSAKKGFSYRLRDDFKDITDIYIIKRNIFCSYNVYEENGNKYINLYNEPDIFKEVNKKQYKDFDNKTKKGVEKILKHIEEVWCSSNKEQYEFVLRWLTRLFHKKRNYTALYLYSGQGTGKSIIIEFIVSILTYELAAVLQDINAIISFNGILEGKILTTLSEIGAVNKGTWMRYSNMIKPLITDKNIQRRQKYEIDKVMQNHLNVIIDSNEEAIRIENDDRRICALDISNKYKGNNEYFNELGKYVDNEDVKVAFLRYFLEREADDKVEKPPITETSKSFKMSNLDPLISCIKNNYLFEHKGIDKIKCADFYKVIQYGLTDKYNENNFTRKLNIYFKTTKTSDHHPLYISYTYEELLNLYIKNGWLSSDEIYELKDKNEGSLTQDALNFNKVKTNEDKKEDIEEDDNNNDLLNENKKLKEEIERLKQLLNNKEEKKEEIKEIKEIKEEPKKKRLMIINNNDDDDDLKVDEVKPKQKQTKYKKQTKEEQEKNLKQTQKSFDNKKNIKTSKDKINIFDDIE